MPRGRCVLPKNTDGDSDCFEITTFYTPEHRKPKLSDRILFILKSLRIRLFGR